MLIVALLFISCHSSEPLPEPPTIATSVENQASSDTNAIRPPEPTVWALQIDACTDPGITCRAASALDLQLRQLPRNARFSFLLQLLSHTSPRVKAYALYRMYPFRNRMEMLPELERILTQAHDPLLLKLAAALSLISNSSQAAALFMRTYERLPKEVRNTVAWAIRMHYTHLDVVFLEKLREDDNPTIRATAREIQSVHTDSATLLLDCVRTLGPDAPACAVSLARIEHVNDADIEHLVHELLARAENSRRLLAVPPELAFSIELLHGQKRINTQKASELLEIMLSSRKLEDATRAQAAFSLGRVKGRLAIPFLQRFRKDSRKKVGYAARRVLYLLESEP